MNLMYCFPVARLAAGATFALNELRNRYTIDGVKFKIAILGQNQYEIAEPVPVN